MSKEVSIDDLAQDIDKIFTKNRKVQEEKIDLESYMKTLVKDVVHNVLCKNNDTFELWVKLKNTDNLIVVVNELEKCYPSSSFAIHEYDMISNFIKCEMGELDISVIRAHYEKEYLRYSKRSEVLDELEKRSSELKQNYGSTMTLLNQKALELQEKYERKIRELRNEQALERIKIDNLIAETPKKYQDEINSLSEKIGQLKKCSHGFMYDSTVFVKNN